MRPSRPDHAPATTKYQRRKTDAVDPGLGGRYFRYANPRRSVFPTPYPEEELRAVSVPTLLLVGDKEQTFDPRRALANATRLVPGLQAELLSGAGHLLAIDKAQQVNQRMLQFLGS
jgi:pimeloyl-ACP methyl ester carboxylesterase